MERHIDINQFDYDLPDERIAKFPLAERSASKLLVYRNGAISESRFDRLGEELPEGAMLVFNNTKVIRARIIMHKPSGARIEARFPLCGSSMFRTIANGQSLLSPGTHSRHTPKTD